MTYANDCIQMQDEQRRRGLKRIEKHTDAELNAAIELAARKFGPDFYLMLHGIDAYMERRKRRTAKREAARTRRLDAFFGNNNQWFDERTKW